MTSQLNILTALLYAAGDEGIERDRLAQLIEADIEALRRTFKSDVFSIRRYGEKYFLELLPAYNQHIEALVVQQTERKLTQASMETLAIIAYNQPVTRGDVEALRGVNSDGPVRTLIERNLVRVDTEGARSQQLYTTDYFLQVFGLTSIEELPEHNADATQEEIDLFFRSLKEEE